MHLNAIYREAQAGREALAECVHALERAARAESLLEKPARFWAVRQARRQFGIAAQRLEVVRRHLRGTRHHTGQLAVDSSGGYAVNELLGGGLLDALAAIAIDARATSCAAVRDLLANVDQLLLRMRKAGAVG